MATVWYFVRNGQTVGPVSVQKLKERADPLAYVASQIAIWIVIAVIFGFTIGWLARGRSKGSRSPRRKGRVKFK